MRIGYNIQTDPRWRNESMGLPGDFLWRWGCLITSLANIIQAVLESPFTPKDMNCLIIELKAYAYLDNPNVKKNKASNIIWKKIKAHFTSLQITRKIDPSLFEAGANNYYIACVTHRKTKKPHYINVIAKRGVFFCCFDVEYGEIRYYRKEEIQYLHKIEVIGDVSECIAERA